jgi:hypothetical protein
MSELYKISLDIVYYFKIKSNICIPVSFPISAHYRILTTVLYTIPGHYLLFVTVLSSIAENYQVFLTVVRF